MIHLICGTKLEWQSNRGFWLCPKCKVKITVGNHKEAVKNQEERMATHREYFMEATDFFGYGRQFLRDAISFHGVSIHIGEELCTLAKYCFDRAKNQASLASEGGVESALYLLRMIEEQEQKLREVIG